MAAAKTKARVTEKRGSKNKKSGDQSLREWLVRNNFMCHCFGFEKFEALQKVLSDVEEGVDEEDRSFYSETLLRHKKFRENQHLTPDKLREYDENITRHMSRINEKRDRKIKLKYYQWLAAVFTEYYLENYFNHHIKLLGDLEKDTFDFISSKPNTISEDVDFKQLANFINSLEDLSKCAYWMATGSGKTFLVHLNYYQYLHYNERAPENRKLHYDRIILITPNSDLTRQHLREMELSGIPCGEFNTAGLSSYFQVDNGDLVSVLEITRFKEEKSDSGQRTVDVEEFGRKNLIFVDEAHKGSGGEKWIGHRDKLAKEGFTFEYSATFGQAAAGDDKVTLQKFAKTILFDYSYPHFYNDGYGKEYRILNINKDSYDKKNNLLLGNLLTYYEQKLVFSHNTEITQIHNLAEPLWIFVGNKVNVSGKKSDVFTVVKFLNKVLSNKTWAVQTIEEFLRGNSGLKDQTTGHDPFDPTYPEQRLRYIRDTGMTAEEMYADMLRRVFNVSSGEPLGLTLVQLKGRGDGEIGLKCGDNDFFADIYVGEPAKFIKLVEKESKEESQGGFSLPMSLGTKIPPINIGSSIDHPSLFKAIDSPQSTLNILIGAKKFIEGWDCYRVSCMGLLNIGKSEGTEIIQLFGRGVRLRGKDFSLKRSTNENGDQLPDLPLLETLNIFGVEAKYIGELRNFLMVEGAKVENTIEKIIDIKPKKEYLKKGLLVPEWDKLGFSREERLVFIPDMAESVTINRFTRVETEQSERFDNLEADTAFLTSMDIDSSYFDFIDWDKMYFELLDYKNQKGWKNVVFTKDTLRQIIEDKSKYTLYCPAKEVRPSSFEQLGILEEIIVGILRKSLNTAHGKKKNLWMKNHSRLSELDESNGNFKFRKFSVKINETEKEIVQTLDEISANMKEFLHGSNSKYIKNVCFDTHLFQPLLTKVRKYTKKLSISPEGLNEGEEKFVEKLQAFVKDEERNSAIKDYEIYLLRNLPKNGVGFYNKTWFYPDFIIWMQHVESGAQRIIFADPKGMAHLNGFEDEKVQLCHEIKKLQSELCKNRGKDDVILDSYIISVTDRVNTNYIFKPKSPGDYDKNHLLFLDDEKLIEKILIG
ncbi:MAG: DEAD/DEAH box helicase family protein [Methanogenium sp.]|nr:DEAD/DEAH box helicase family protein [Methanogenium sp.]